MFTVYMHVFPNGKRYIGITSTTAQRRWGKNGSCYKSQKHLYSAIAKYGWDNIEHIVVAENLTKDEACKIEINLVRQYKSNIVKYGYNVMKGGQCASVGIKRTESYKKHMSEMMKGNRNGVHKNSPEQREAISKRMMGNNFGARRNITEEYKKKALESQPNRVVIEQYTLDGELVATYRSVNEAHRITGIWNIAEASRLNSRSKTSGGYIWKRRALQGD